VKWNAKDTKVNRRISSYPIDKTCPRNPVCIDYVNKALMFQFRIHQERPISSSQTLNIIFHLCPKGTTGFAHWFKEVFKFPWMCIILLDLVGCIIYRL